MIVKGKHLHLDCPSGVAGDMLLGAFFDLGVPVEMVRDVLAKLPLTGWKLTVEKAMRGGLAGTDVKVVIDAHEHAHDHGHAHDHDHDDHHDDHHHDHHARPGDVRHAGWHDSHHAHRHYRDIRAMLDALPADVRRVARDAFERIAEVEARLHGTTVDDVAFHEVGAIDSIVDIVGTAAAVAYLAPASISATPLPLGHGTIKTAHGLLPIPAPATLAILAAARVPTASGDSPSELTTPTGAALIAQLAQTFGAMPAGRVLATGWGAGDRELADRPNLVRAVLLEPAPARDARPASTAPGVGDEVVELTANVDDMSPELCDHVIERLLAAGALDAWWTPITMKKGRPALLLGAICPPAAFDAVARVVLTETTTIGLRHSTRARRVLDRRSETVDTPWGPIAVKLALLDGKPVNAAPEHDDCRRVARDQNVPLKQVYAAAVAAAQRFLLP